MGKIIIFNIIMMSYFVGFSQNTKPYIIKKIETFHITNHPKYLEIVDTLNPNIKFAKVPDDFGGLTPSYPIAISYERIPCSLSHDIVCLYDNSRFGISISNLFILKNNELFEINTFKKFKQIYAPVESKEEALSFVAARIYCLLCLPIIYNFELLKYEKEVKVLKKELTPTSVTEVENGYKVIIITKYEDYFETEYFVSKNGDVKQVKEEKVIEYLGERILLD